MMEVVTGQFPWAKPRLELLLSTIFAPLLISPC